METEKSNKTPKIFTNPFLQELFEKFEDEYIEEDYEDEGGSI